MTNHRFVIIHQHDTLDLPTLANKLRHLSDSDMPSNTMHIESLDLSYSDTLNMHTLKLVITDARSREPWRITIRLHPSIHQQFTVQPFQSKKTLHIKCGLEMSLFCFYPKDKYHTIIDPSADGSHIIKEIACTLSKQTANAVVVELLETTLLVYLNGRPAKAFECKNTV